MNVKYQGEGTVIIVGANSGIGVALTHLLHQSGVRCLAIDIQKESVLGTKDDLAYIQCDPTDLSAMRALAEQIETTNLIIGLVNLSGTIKYFGSIEAASDEDWNETFNINFQSCLNSCRSFAPLLRRSTKASIVNMSSGLAFIGQKNYGPYAAAKAAIVNLSKTLATELGPLIRVNSLAPGAVETPFIRTKDGGTRFDLDQYKKRVLTGSIAQPSEIAQVIMFLLSDGASHINGQCIHVNGGIS